MPTQVQQPLVRVNELITNSVPSQPIGGTVKIYESLLMSVKMHRKDVALFRERLIGKEYSCKQTISHYILFHYNSNSLNSASIILTIVNIVMNVDCTTIVVYIFQKQCLPQLLKQLVILIMKITQKSPRIFLWTKLSKDDSHNWLIVASLKSACTLTTYFISRGLYKRSISPFVQIPLVVSSRGIKIF